MRIFINYLFFTRDEADALIRNESNNDHWPTAGEYINSLEHWLKEVQRQQLIIKDYLNYLTTVKRGHEWFVIRIVNEINTKLKALNAKNKKDEYYLERVEQRKRGEVGVDKFDPVLWEVKSLREGLDFPEYPAIKDRLKNWFDDPNNTIKEVKEIFASYPAGQRETIYNHFGEWNQGRIEKNLRPLEEVDEILDEWLQNSYKNDKEYKHIEQIKSLNIQLKERTEDSIKFVWRVPLETVKEVDNNGKETGKETVNRVLPNIMNYLFYLNGEYYEVNTWKQTDWETVEINAVRSMFYNGYWWVIKTAATGWIHRSPLAGGVEEICNCEPFDYFDSRNKFFSEYQLKFDLYRIGKWESKHKTTIDDDDKTIPKIIVSGHPTIITNTDAEIDKITSTWTQFKEFFTGMEGILYMLLSRNLQGYSYFNDSSLNPNQKTKIPIKTGWRGVGKWNNTTKETDLGENTLTDLLQAQGLLDWDYYHFLSRHLKATIYWRDKPIWDGNYYVLHNEFEIVESTSPSGTCVIIRGSSMELARITEFITAKVGGDNQTNSFLSAIITVGTTVAAAYLTAGVGSGAAAAGAKASSAAAASGAKAAAVKAAGTAASKAFISKNAIGLAVGKAAIGAAGSMAGTALNHSLSYSTTETKESMSIHEFRHKFLNSGSKPLSIILEWNQQCANSFINNRTLFGANRNDAFNVEELGQLLNNEGFCKLIISHWRMVGGNYAQWFGERLADGVFLEKNWGSTMKIEVPQNKVAVNKGGVVRKAWNEITITDTVSVGSGWDNISHLGGGFWVYKVSQNKWPGKPNGIWVLDQGGSRGDNLLGWIMSELHRRKGFIGSEDSGKWVVKHPGYAFTGERIDIPDKYKWKVIDGKKLCPLEYQLDFFSGGDASTAGSEYNGDYILVHKEESGNLSRLSIEIKGWHRVVNNVSNPEGIPPAGTLPTNPLGSGGQAPNPLNISGTLPPGGQGEIIIEPGAGGGGVGDIDVNIEEETQNEPPEIQQETQEEIQEENQTQDETQNETNNQNDDENTYE